MENISILNEQLNIKGLEDCDILQHDTNEDIDCCITCYRFNVCSEYAISKLK